MPLNVEDIDIRNFIEEVAKHQEDVTESRTVISDLRDFWNFYEGLQKLNRDFENIFGKNSSKVYKEDVNAYLSRQISYLDHINYLLSKLEFKIVKNDSVKEEKDIILREKFENVRTLIIYQNLLRELEELEKMSDYKNTSKYVEIKEKLEKMGIKAVNAEQDLKFPEIAAKDLESEKYKINKEAFRYSSVSDKIKYLEKIMDNILTYPTQNYIQTTVDNKIVDVPKDFYARFVNYVAILDECKEKQKRLDETISRNDYDLSEIISNDDFNSDENVNQELEAQIAMHDKSLKEKARQEENDYIRKASRITEIINQMYNLGVNDENAIKANLMPVTLPNNVVININKNDYEKFEKLCSEYKKCDPESLSTLTSYTSEEDIKRNIEFLKSYGKQDKQTFEQLAKQKTLLREIKETKKKKKSRTIIDLFRTIGISFNNIKYYTNAAQSPINFVKYGKYPDKDKMSFLNNIATKVLKFKKTKVSNLQEQSLKKNAFKLASDGESVYAVTSSPEELDEESSNVINEISKASHLLPSGDKKTNKVTGRKKKTSKTGVVCLAACVGTLGIYFGEIISGAELLENNKFLKNVKENVNSFQEVNIDSQIDYEKLATKIYERSSISKKTVEDNDFKTSLDEMLNPETKNDYSTLATVHLTNVPKTDENQEREATGIAYEYNGNTIWLSKDDPNFEAKRKAYLNNGAKEVAFRSNELSPNISDNVSDINLEGGLKR